MPTKIIAGRVNSDGTIPEENQSGGYYVRALGGGLFIVEFDAALPATPAVVVKQNNRSWDDFDYGGGNTRDNVVVLAVDNKGFKVATGDGDGSKEDRNFAFIAAVPTTTGADSIPALVWGDVNANAGTHSGSGFETTGLGDGVYLVDFDQAFESLSSVVVTQNYKDWEAFTFNTGKTTDNAVIVAAKASQFKYITGDSAGTKTDRNCMFVAAGVRSGAVAPRVTFGSVNADGTTHVFGQHDFTVSKTGTGTYDIAFSPPFSSNPAMLVTQNYRDWTDFKYGGGDTRDNAVVVAVNSAHAVVITGQQDGSKVDRNFGFLVVG